jgi:hypothetical protein
MSMQGAPAAGVISPTWTWGSSSLLHFDNSLPNDLSDQLAQISLPEPAVCSIYFQATFRPSNPADVRVGTLTINLSAGVGRVTVPRQVSFSGQPASGAPLEFTMPFVPVHALQVDVECTAFFTNPASADLQMYLLVTPITRIPQKIQQLQFGMATPGEADSLDDELRENLEDESPSVAQILEGEADERVHGVEGDDEPEEVAAAPQWLLGLVDRFHERYGRAPTRGELRQVAARHLRRARRRAAG